MQSIPNTKLHLMLPAGFLPDAVMLRYQAAYREQGYLYSEMYNALESTVSRIEIPNNRIDENVAAGVSNTPLTNDKAELPGKRRMMTVTFTVSTDDLNLNLVQDAISLNMQLHASANAKTYVSFNNMQLHALDGGGRVVGTFTYRRVGLVASTPVETDADGARTFGITFSYNTYNASYVPAKNASDAVATVPVPATPLSKERYVVGSEGSHLVALYVEFDPVSVLVYVNGILQAPHVYEVQAGGAFLPTEAGLLPGDVVEVEYALPYSRVSNGVVLATAPADGELRVRMPTGSGAYLRACYVNGVKLDGIFFEASGDDLLISADSELSRGDVVCLVYY